MLWARTGMRRGAWCALFALTLQFTAAFGHVHGGDGVRLHGRAPLSMLAVESASVGMPDTPAVPVMPGALFPDYCAICVVVGLTGNALPAAAPVLAPPAAGPRQRLFADVDSVAASSPHRVFQARAPPRV